MFRTGHATSRENISRFGAGWVVAKKSFKIRSSYSILGYLPTPLGHPGARGRGDMGMGRPLSRTRLKNTKLFLLNVCWMSANRLWSQIFSFWCDLAILGLDCGDWVGGGRFYKGKVLSNGVPGGERERDGHVTMRPLHKENGNKIAETVVLV